MKKLVPFSEYLKFDNNISEITSIALDNTLKLDTNIISGYFTISGTYKKISSTVEEEFKFDLPVNIAIDNKYDTSNCIVSIDDFSYQVENEEKLLVNITVMLDDLDLKSNQIEVIDEDTTNINIKNEINVTNNIIDNQEYSVYRVYTVKESDSLDIIYDKFNVNYEILSSYNNLDNLKPGYKLIIPSVDE